MKTCVYQQVQDQAAELAGRPRDKLPVSEALMLLSGAALELKVMWNSCCWPELCDNLSKGPFTPVNAAGVLTVSKQEGTANEIGDVLGVFSGDPRNTTGCAAPIKWEIGNGQIYLLQPFSAPQSTLWIDYQLPPTDLLAVAASPTTALPTLGNTANPASLPGTLLPARFLLPLSMKAAAMLLEMDGNIQAAMTLKGLADSNLDWQSAQPEMNAPKWRGAIRR